MANPRFEIVDEGQPVQPQMRPQMAAPGQDPAFSAMMLALKTLSQKTIVALSRLAGLAMVGSVFWLFMSIPNPSQTQIIWGGMYAMFILAVAFIMGRVRS